MTICSRKHLLSLLAVLVCAASVSLHAQASSNESEIEILATRTAERVAKTHADHVLVIITQGCLLDPDICGTLDLKIRVALQMAIPGAQLLTRADVLPLLAKHGLLPVDAYTFAAELPAVDLGAETMVSESLKWLQEGYEAEIKVTDLVKHKDLDDFKLKLARPVSDSGTEALVFREPADGPALVIPRGPTSSSLAHWFPICEKCSEPRYTAEASFKGVHGIVLLAVTVTTQGRAEHISVVRALGAGLTEAAVQAVRGWSFKPAAGPDGKPFATRTRIEVNFRLTH
jgi:TonB family protein